MRYARPATSLVIIFCLSVLPAYAQQPAAHPPPQLTISRATVSGLETASPTISIDGTHFSAAVHVSMGAAGGLFQPLNVLSVTSDQIVAQLNTAQPGTYVL